MTCVNGGNELCAQNIENHYRFNNEHLHNIIQLLDCVPWDHVSNEHNSLLILGFLVYRGALGLCTIEFLTSSFEPRPLSLEKKTII